MTKRTSRRRASRPRANATNTNPYVAQSKRAEALFRAALEERGLAHFVGSLKRRVRKGYGAEIEVHLTSDASRRRVGQEVFHLAREMFSPPAYRVPGSPNSPWFAIHLEPASFVGVDDTVEFETGEGRVHGKVVELRKAHGDLVVDAIGLRFTVAPEDVVVINRALKTNGRRKRASRR